MPNPSSSHAESPPPREPERKVLARAVGVWWVQRLLEAARRRRLTPSRDDEELPGPASAGS
jgi:hypothetical protein